LINDGPSSLSFDDGGGGLGLAIGPGIGHPGANVSRAMFNVQKVDTMASGADQFDSIHLTEVGARQDFALPDVEWGAVQNLYFMIAAIYAGDQGFVIARTLMDRNVSSLATSHGSDISLFPTLELYHAPLMLQSGARAAYD